MNPVLAAEPAKNLGSDGERFLLLFCYLLHGLCFTVLSAVIALIINAVQMRKSESEFIRSHHRWLWRTFWWGLLLAIVSLILCFVWIGFGVFLVVCLWWLYRVIYGAMHFIEQKPMPV